MTTTTTTTTRRNAMLDTLWSLIGVLLLGCFYMVPRILLDADTVRGALRGLVAYLVLGNLYAVLYILARTPTVTA